MLTKKQKLIDNVNVDEIFARSLTHFVPLGQSAPSLYPSSASVYLDGGPVGQIVRGGCHRGDYYRIKGYPNTDPISARGWLNIKIGQAVEDIFIEQMKRAGVFVASQVPIYVNGLSISGRSDAINRYMHISKDKAHEMLYGVEVKSFAKPYMHKQIMGHYAGRGGDRHFVLPQPKIEGVLQAALYAYYLRENLDGFKLYYIARDDGDRQQFGVFVKETKDKPTQVLVTNTEYAKPNVMPFTIDNIMERYEELSGKLSVNTPPPREYYLHYPVANMEKYYEANILAKSKFDKWVKAGKPKDRDDTPGDWQCSYCRYKTGCHTDKWER